MFATQAINKNKRIVDYAGEKIKQSREPQAREPLLKAGHIWCFKLNRLYVRDAAVGGNVARYINHSCAPELLHPGHWRHHLDPRRPQYPAAAKS